MYIYSLQYTEHLHKSPISIAEQSRLPRPASRGPDEDRPRQITRFSIALIIVFFHVQLVRLVSLSGHLPEGRVRDPQHCSYHG
jgi:hypothetical protein